MHRRGTYSIVARDPSSGELGVAVQSHWFSVGSVVVVGAAGRRRGSDAVGRRDRPRARRAGRDGARAWTPRGIAAVLADDEQASYRQLGVVDAQGNAAAHTGEACIPAPARSSAMASPARRT